MRFKEGYSALAGCPHLSLLLSLSGRHSEMLGSTTDLVKSATYSSTIPEDRS